MASQDIILEDIPNLNLGIDEPYLLFGTASSGVRLVYTIESGGAHAEIVDGIQLNPLSPGQVTVRATAPAKDEYDEATIDKTFDVLDGDFYESAENLNVIKNRLDADTLMLNEMSKISVKNIGKISFDFTEESQVLIIINGQEYRIEYSRFAKKFINSSIAFWEAEIIAENVRLQSNVNRVKNA